MDSCVITASREERVPRSGPVRKKPRRKANVKPTTDNRKPVNDVFHCSVLGCQFSVLDSHLALLEPRSEVVEFLPGARVGGIHRQDLAESPVRLGAPVRPGRRQRNPQIEAPGDVLHVGPEGLAVRHRRVPIPLEADERLAAQRVELPADLTQPGGVIERGQGRSVVAQG